MDKNQFHRRLRSGVIFFSVILLCFLWVLYDLQINQGAAFLAQSTRKIALTETVDAARGEIFDRYGNPIVTNRVSYQVTLDASLMGDDKQNNIRMLLELCTSEGVAWEDTLPISTTAPFVYTFDSSTSTANSRFSQLMSDRKWVDSQATAILGGAEVDSMPSAEDMLAQMRLDSLFAIPGDFTDEEARLVLGVLYELTLRTKGITWIDYIFAEDVDMSFITRVKESNLSGVSIDPVTVREYHTTAAAHILGTVGSITPEEWEYYQALGYDMDAIVGRDGIEKAFEDELHGTSGVRISETTTSGKIVSQHWQTNAITGEELSPSAGNDVFLTLDIRLQEAVEEALASGVADLNSEAIEGAAAVIIDVDDGGVLAMASYPTYDLANFSAVYNTLAEDPLNPMLNRATMGTYAPGSTFKMVTAVGALEEGVITPTSIYQDTGRYTYYRDYQPMCWIFRETGATHGNQNVSQAITNSCNLFFYDAGRRLGVLKLNEYASAFGLGESTGLELPERTGVVAGPTYTESLGQVWNEGSVLAAAIGQENNQFTPLQLANYIATLANGGNRWDAHLLHSVYEGDLSQVVMGYEPVLNNAIDIAPENLEAVKEGMLAVTESGSARWAFANLGVSVAAKTGSVQVAGSEESNAVFVCFAPYDDPEIALAIVVEKGGGGSGLSYIAADILEAYFSLSSPLSEPEGENTLLH